MLIIFSIHNAFGQGGVWTWMHGTQNPGNVGNYGVKGISAPTNIPPARAYAAYCKDASGIFWLFGGYNSSTVFNDLWKFDVKTNEWTWVNGPQYATNNIGNYGTKGLSSPTNIPPAKSDASCWTGQDGYLYLYGGNYPINGVPTSSLRDDMWRYDIALNEWTWITGDISIGITQSNNGTKGVPAATNTPGFRYLTTRNGWVYDNKLWLIGGNTFTPGFQIPSNDLWTFDLSTNLWTWVSGEATPPYAGNFGTQNVADVNNAPPGRWALCSWRNKDKFYLAGGGFTRNDYWSYDPNTNEWTWLGGSQFQNDAGNGSQNCVASKQFVPHGRRVKAQYAEKDICSPTHWLFGGHSQARAEDYNDLWAFNSDSSTWNLVWGTNGAGLTASYGSLGIANQSNAPPGRAAAAMWVDNDNNIWIFGGAQQNWDIIGDMWMFAIDTNCVQPQNIEDSLWSKEVTICQNDSAVINFQPYDDVSSSPTSSSYYDAPSGTLYLFPKSEVVYTITVSGSSCTKNEIGTVTVKFSDGPQASFELFPNVTTLADPRFSTNNTSTNANQYEWFTGQSLISTQKNITHSFDKIGEHCITLIAKNNCGEDTTTKCGTVESDIYIPNAFSPNGDGNNDIIKIISLTPVNLKVFAIYNRWGECVFQTNDWRNGWDGKQKGVDCEIGTYFYFINYKFGEADKRLRGDLTLIR